jgi:UDP-2-acetamido-2-deoxy-ribo-hexuluronate aminotransferase
MQFIDLKTQYEKIKKDLNQRISNVLLHQQHIFGPEVLELEARLSEYVQTPHCITVSNGSDALLLALMALDIGQNDEVITTPFTFAATLGSILLAGAKPVLVDIELETYNLDPQLIEASITPKTKAILAVNLYGQCPDYSTISEIAKKHNLWIIEDAAQSFGATQNGKKSCNFGDIATTSFFRLSL